MTLRLRYILSDIVIIRSCAGQAQGPRLRPTAAPCPYQLHHPSDPIIAIRISAPQEGKRKAPASAQPPPLAPTSVRPAITIPVQIFCGRCEIVGKW
ncbi:MAG TPA: hypothetical protein VFU49_18410 [Ktedonobacteraceae bacterium]|nr:hypothetical protein [Ktedonobacteraceae bacterium]